MPEKTVHPYFKVVKGVPAALVRSYKNPLYDSDEVTAAAPGTERILFQRPIGQTTAAATVKTLLHTNMSNAGQLGTPLSFDVFGFNLRMPKGITIGNYNLIAGNGVVEVIFGSDTRFLVVPLEDIPSGVDTEGMGATDAPHTGLGQSDSLYRFDVNGRALHINSTESFQVRISFPSGNAGVTGNQLLRFYIRGILYKGV